MSGYTTYNQWKRIEDHADKLGFRIGNPKSGSWGRDDNGQYDMVAIFPRDHELPIYTRDAEIFCGTFAQLSVFLAGWAKSREYDTYLRMTDDKRRKKFEDAERARQAEQRKREEQKKMLKVLKSSDQQNQVSKK